MKITRNDSIVEINQSKRFGFGANWTKFLKDLDDERIKLATASLQSMLQCNDLQGKSFLDIGSGSGLFSLAARNLGATVHSFDYDHLSVACTQELKDRYWRNDLNWTIDLGSVLDENYLNSLGAFDIVYSWGVLHHTGDMNRALGNAAMMVKNEGKLFISIYNDQGIPSKLWLLVKKAYNRIPKGLRWIILWPAILHLWGPPLIRDFLLGRPFWSWRNYSRKSLRGMSPWRDVVDWVGGLPFEVATPEVIFRFFRDRGFILQELSTCRGKLGCNQYVFSRPDTSLLNPTRIPTTR